jgi:hypothetical protein
MAIKCTACGHVHEQNAIPVKCAGCGMDDLSKYERVASDIDPVAHEKEKKLLESMKRK